MLGEETTKVGISHLGVMHVTLQCRVGLVMILAPLKRKRSYDSSNDPMQATHPGEVSPPSGQRKKRRKKSTVPQENQSRFTPWIPAVRPTALVSGSLEQRLVVVTIPLSTYTLKFAKDCITRSSR